MLFLSGSAPPGPDNSITVSDRPHLGRVHAQGVTHDSQATLPAADVVGGSCRGIDRHRTRRAGRTILHLSQRQQHRLSDSGKCADRHLAAPGPVQPAVPVLRWRLARLPPWRKSLGLGNTACTRRELGRNHADLCHLRVDVDDAPRLTGPAAKRKMKISLYVTGLPVAATASAFASMLPMVTWLRWVTRSVSLAVASSCIQLRGLSIHSGMRMSATAVWDSAPRKLSGTSTRSTLATR